MTIRSAFDVGPDMYQKIRCPMLVNQGEDDQIQPCALGRSVTETRLYRLRKASLRARQVRQEELLILIAALVVNLP